MEVVLPYFCLTVAGTEGNWFSHETQVNTFQLEELLATKLRALYERKKGRDAFDLWLAIKEKIN